MTTTVGHDDLRAAKRDPVVFAELLVGEPLWPHQEEVARCNERVLALCCGRRSGKTRTLAIKALHRAFSKARSRVLIAAASEDSSKETLQECSLLATSPLLAGSVINDDKTLMTLSNGSTIRAVAASVKAIRGKGADLLIIDEAAFVDEEIWTAAYFTTLDQPDAQVILSSTPYGKRDRFFGRAFITGQSRKDRHRAWQWPSSISPRVTDEEIEFARRTMTPRTFTQEVLAEWVDEAGAYFTHDEVMACVADYELTPPSAADAQLAVAGVDWGFSVDANALVLIAALQDGDLNLERHPDELVFFVPWLEARYRMPFSEFVRYVANDVTATRERTIDPRRSLASQLNERERGYYLYSIASETNGVGLGPTQDLRNALTRSRKPATVRGIHTDARRKQTAFGLVKLLVQRGRLVLPRHPELLKQLLGLEFETADSGLLRIAVPDRVGHDDIAMALSQAVSSLNMWRAARRGDEPMLSRASLGTVLETENGTRIPQRPRSLPSSRPFRSAQGDEGQEW